MKKRSRGKQRKSYLTNSVSNMDEGGSEMNEHDGKSSKIDDEKSQDSTTDIKSLKSFVEESWSKRQKVFTIQRNNPYLIKLKIPGGIIKNSH